MLKKLPWILLVGLVLVSALQTLKSCRLANDYKQLTKKYETLKTETEAQEKARLQYIADLEAVILDAQAQNEDLYSSIHVKETSIAGLKARAKELESIAAKVTDKDEWIAVLQEEVFVWSSAFNLLEQASLEKDAIIFNLTQQYQAQLKISIDYKKMWENEKALRGIAEERIVILEKRQGSLLSLSLPNQGIVIGLAVLSVLFIVSR